MKKWRVPVTYRVPVRSGEWAVLEPCYQYFDRIEAGGSGEAWVSATNLAHFADPNLLPWSKSVYAERHDRPDGVIEQLDGCIAKGWKHVTVP